MLPFLIVVALAAALMGMLNSLQHYFVPALSPAMFNVATIACALTLVPLMPALGWPPIMAIAIAVMLGGVGQVAVQWPALRREGFRYRPVLDWRDPELRQRPAADGPGHARLAATQVNLFVNTLLATSEGTGAVSWLTYAFRLMYLPIGLFGVSIATAVLPAVSRHAAIDDVAGVRDTLSRGVSLDADGERAGDGRPDRPRHADRAAAVRARPVPAVRHDGHGRRAALLCARPGWLLDGADRVAGLLRARGRAACRSMRQRRLDRRQPRR